MVGAVTWGIEKGVRQATVSVQVPDGCLSNRLFVTEVLHFSKLNSVCLGSGTLTLLTAALRHQLTLLIPIKIECVYSAGTHSTKGLIICKHWTCLWRSITLASAVIDIIINVL
jgi:hypothetical protein